MSDKAQKRKATAPLVPDEEDPPTEPARPEDAAGARDRAVRPREEEDSQLQHRLSGLETSED